MQFKYDVLVIGGGHAGCEAASAAAKLGAETCLITMDMNKIAQMSCNPAVGGIAKGQIVREIDALGGQMGLITDATAIQFRMLNRGKGPAVWSPRAQCDRAKFILEWRKRLDEIDHLSIWQDQADELIVENGEAVGVRTVWGTELRAKSIIVTAGTFLNGLMHIGRYQIPGGRCSEPAVYHFSESISRHGIRVSRMKTGTPVRIDARSVHFEDMERQDGETDFHRFSYIGEHRTLKQLPCWICYTTEESHTVLHQGLVDSPLFNGQIQSTGPRYCPSIETKLVTFPDKNQHLLFLEPEGEDTNEMYLNGFSSSMPMEIQLNALHRIPALREAKTYRAGYAIEYDYFDPTQLKQTLESKVIKGLFLNRDESYIGVLIDDLTTKGVDEPYRMFTSRAEYRILLRQDDADARLTERAYYLGLADRNRYDQWIQKKAAIARIVDFCNTTSVKPKDINTSLEAIGTTPLHEGCKVADLIARPQITLNNLSEAIPELKALIESAPDRCAEIAEAAEIKMKYKGYIERERLIADKMHRLEDIKIKDRFDYEKLHEISTEGRQKLARINPETLAQASRIPGVSPSDINVLLVLLHR